MLWYAGREIFSYYHEALVTDIHVLEVLLIEYGHIVEVSMQKKGVLHETKGVLLIDDGEDVICLL